MKIGLVRRGYSATGGAESYLKRLGGELVKAGHEPVLFGSKEWTPERWSHGETLLVEGRTPAAFSKALTQLDPRNRCDVVFSLERVLACDCYRAGDGVHHAWLKRRRRYESPWRGMFRAFSSKHRQLLTLERRLFRAETLGAVIANSSMVRQEITETYGYPVKNIHVIPNGLETQAFQSTDHREEVRKQLGIPSSQAVVLFAGSGWERKGLRFAVEAMEKVKGDVVLLVAGRGRQKQFRKSSRVRFLGPVADMPRYYGAADVFILPTIYDPFSNACLEALAAGLPVITTAANGFAEVTRPDLDGTIVQDPADTDNLARAIGHWAGMEASTMASTRRQRQEAAQSWSISRNVASTINVLQAFATRKMV